MEQQFRLDTTGRKDPQPSRCAKTGPPFTRLTVKSVKYAQEDRCYTVPIPIRESVVAVVRLRWIAIVDRNHLAQSVGAPAPPRASLSYSWSHDEERSTASVSPNGEGTACPSGLSQAELKTYNQLTESMNATLASEPACPGDGNEDKVVNLDDVANWFYFSTNGVPQQNAPPNTSSWYDFNHDGNTDTVDLQTIVKNFGRHCGTKN